MARTHKTMAALLSAAALAVAVAPIATANPSPPTNGGNGAGHRVGNVVEFQIEEDGNALIRYRPHAVGAVGGKEFEAQFHAAHQALELLHEPLRGIEIGRVDRAENGRAETEPERA